MRVCHRFALLCFYIRHHIYDRNECMRILSRLYTYLYSPVGIPTMSIIFCSASIVGAIKTISSAYRKMDTHVTDIQHPILLSTTQFTISSIKIAKKCGESTPPCLTPDLSLKKSVNISPHLTQVADVLNQSTKIFIN